MRRSIGLVVLLLAAESHALERTDAPRIRNNIQKKPLGQKRPRTELTATPPPPPEPFWKHPIVRKAAKRAIGGGLSGWIAGVIQVLCLMWLRTTMNYQYRHGTSTIAAMRTLYAQGGLPRFYKGLGWALFQTPLSRFGDAAANSGVLELLSTSSLPVGARTACAGLAASCWRVFLTPLDTLKTTLQVEGSTAYQLLIDKVAKHGISQLYSGALATMAASFVGNYPWFVTFNYLDKTIPKADPDGPLRYKVSRSALLGVCATCVSDTVANSLRVIKTTKQTSAEAIGYLRAASLVLEKDGWAGLLLRGLSTRLITNALQASVFTIVWKLIEERIHMREAAEQQRSKEEEAEGEEEKEEYSEDAGWQVKEPESQEGEEASEEGQEEAEEAEAEERSESD